MSIERRGTEPDLIGYQLGLLDQDEAAAVADQLVASPELQRQRSELAETLRPLDRLTVAPAGRALVDAVLTRIAKAPRLVSSPRNRALLSGDDAPNRGRTVSLRELVGVAAAIALFVSVFVPGYQHSRRQAQQMTCMENLRVIGKGHASYAAAFNDMFPFAGAPAGPWGVKPLEREITPVGNSRGIYLPLRLGFIDKPETYICKARPDTPMAAEQVLRLTDFPSPRNVSYSPQLLIVPLRLPAVDPTLPLISDPSAQFEGRIVHGTNVWNSNSHGHGAGQNVARAGGDVIWAPRPDIGPLGDNIFKIGDQTEYRGDELPPQSPTDVFLAP